MDKKKTSHETTKKPSFSMLFGHPFRVPNSLGNNFSAVKNTDERKMGRKLRRGKSGNSIFSLIFDGKKSKSS